MKSIALGVGTLLFAACLAQSYFASTMVPEQPRKFDEFGDVSCEDELARLDNFSQAVLNDLDAHAYIIVYGGRRGRLNEAKARAARMKFYLVQIRGFDKRRIVTVDGGYRVELTSEFWIVPRGGLAPLRQTN